MGKSTAIGRAVIGRTVEGRYRIEAEIGAGGMGVVYRARQLNVDRDVALKVLPEHRADEKRAVEQFLVETKAVSRLTSPHTVTLYDAGRLDDGTPFLAMELLEGRTLRARLAERPCEVDEAIRIVDGIALSLAEAHARGIVHRDVKPSNVLLAKTPGHAPTPKLLDFGLARLSDAASPERRAAGTVRYMPPEALRGEPVDARADVYGLAMLTYEVLAGAHPFADRDDDALIEAQLTEMPPPLDEVCSALLPQQAVKLLARSLAKPKRLRPKDAGAFRMKLREAFDLPVAGEIEAEVVTADEPETLPSQTVVSRTLDATPAERGRTMWWPLAAVAALGATAYVAYRAHGPESEATLAPTATASAGPETPMATVRVVSVPPGAEVYLDEDRRGQAPLDLSVPHGEEHALELRLAGYRIHSQPLVARGDTNVIVRLDAVPAAPPEPTPEPSTAPRPRPPRRAPPPSRATAKPSANPALRDRVRDYLDD